ncbi:MAG: hypothetical protein QOE08_1205 [Thermoleophilaceae bacterium]|nr:hypothetical protein [Thermoleophilaceae bacterium]
MKERASDLGRKAIALLVLLFGAFVLFKVVVGAVTAIAWLAVGVIAVIAVLWAVLRLL